MGLTIYQILKYVRISHVTDPREFGHLLIIKSINRRYKLDRDAIIRDDGRIFYFYLGNPRDAQDFSQLWNERMTIEAYKDNYLRINNESILYKMTGGFFKSKKFKFNFGGEWRWIDKGDRLVFRAIYRNECNEKEIRKIAVYEKNTREFLFDQKQLSMMLIDEFEIVMLMSCMVFMQSLEKRSLLRRRW
ncbi:hypothetical protein G9A89_008112 [Geosiphon pyriformis]|nr:hypothetical protein G9A89_008112 [Geosiphon pyriformis]